ncbi:hypothetical protein P8452_09760 [Trifolium repens]|nr:hypothetical protein P8452_09760 [Trifolium repens]
MNRSHVLEQSLKKQIYIYQRQPFQIKLLRKCGNLTIFIGGNNSQVICSRLPTQDLTFDNICSRLPIQGFAYVTFQHMRTGSI